jgi:hypothetical protein
MVLDAAISRRLCDAAWLCHRYDPQHDAFHFLNIPRDVHRQVTFLTDEYLPSGQTPLVVRRADALGVVHSTGPVHFIFHSAFCLSTLLARAFDLPGVAMGLKEPVVLNDLVGWRFRGGPPSDVAQVLNDALFMLARPFEPGEATIIKPSNLLNGLADAMMKLRPDARAVFIHAPLETFLKSVAKKGMWGRIWIRDLYVKQLREGLINLGFDQEQYLALTDLQVAATCWLAQHALFQNLISAFGTSRIRPINSEDLLLHPEPCLSEISEHFGLTVAEHSIGDIVRGPAFTRHSKFGGAFDRAARQSEYDEAMRQHGDEIEKVAVWAKAVADHANVNFDLTGAIPRQLYG